MLLLEPGSFISYFPFRYIVPACLTSDLLMSDVPLALLVLTKEFYNTFDQNPPVSSVILKQLHKSSGSMETQLVTANG